MVVEEVERLARVVGLEPQGYPAELHCERIQVHAIDTSADHITQGGAVGGGRGLLLAGADDSELGGDTARSGQEDVTRAAGDVGNA